jgi:hypothetical protein
MALSHAAVIVSTVDFTLLSASFQQLLRRGNFFGYYTWIHICFEKAFV